MAAGLGQPLVGDLTPGSRILVYYDADVVWHTRYLLALVEKTSWMIFNSRRRHLRRRCFRWEHGLGCMENVASGRCSSSWSGRRSHPQVPTRTQCSSIARSYRRRSSTRPPRKTSAWSESTSGWRRRSSRSCWASLCRGQRWRSSKSCRWWQPGSARWRQCASCSCSSSPSSQCHAWRRSCRRRWSDTGDNPGYGWQSLQGVPRSAGLQTMRLLRLAYCRPQDSQVCGDANAGPRWISNGPPSGMARGLRASAVRRPSPRTRGLVTGSPGNGHVRSARCEQHGISGVSCQSAPKNKGTSQTQAGFSRWWWRGNSVYGELRGLEIRLHHFTKAHRMGGVRVAEGGIDRQGKAKSPGREGFVKEARRQRRQGRQVKHSFFFAGLLQGFLPFFLVMFCMPTLVDAGVADGLHDDGVRQRNIFPLPEIPEGFRSDAHFDGWERFANQGINALNELSGCVNSNFSKKKPTRAQKRVLSNIADAYQEASCAVDIDPGTSCLAELCNASKIYQTDRSDVASYARDFVSWPEVETFPVPLLECLPPADSKWLATWQEHMLQPSDVKRSDGSVKQPYTDPILKHKHKEYTGFLKELIQRSMVKFKLDEGYSADLGVFFVRKKNNKQRLIFDTRILNDKLIDPPKTDLPSADAFTRVAIDGSHPFLMGSGDLANAFYTLGVPDSLARMFTLPAVEASKCDVRKVDDIVLRPGDKVVPYLTVLPMGWSWALHFCQQVMNHAINTSGIERIQIISDKGKPVHLRDPDDIACAGYVGNFAVIETSLERVDAGLRIGLTVHEECAASHHAEFVGLTFNGIRGTVRIKPSRIAKLQGSIDELLMRNVASGELLQLLMGHITWAIMARREALSILNACYGFIHQFGQEPQRLWPRVRIELKWISALLPLYWMVYRYFCVRKLTIWLWHLSQTAQWNCDQIYWVTVWALEVPFWGRSRC